MTRRSCIPLLGALLLLAGCQPLFGIERVSLSSESDEADCEAPSVWTSAVRVGNLRVGPGEIDLCVRREGESSYESRPLLDRAGADCPDVGYKQLTVPLSLAPGSYDLKAIPSDGTCSDSGQPTTSLTLEAGDVYSVLLIGDDGSGDPELSAYFDATGARAQTKVRFIHATAGQGALDMGPVGGDALDPVFEDVEFGSEGEGIDASIFDFDHGYLVYPGDFVREVGVAPAGSEQAEWTLPVDFAENGAHSIFAIGAVGAKTYPPKLWTCTDDPIEPDDAQPIFSKCGDPRDVTVEVFDTGLSDQFRDYIEERREPVIQAIGDMDGDLVCLTGLYYPEDVRAAETAVGNRRKVVTSLSHFEAGDILEPNLRTQSGAMPTYDPPACDGSEEELDALIGCLVDGADPLPGCTKAADGEHVMRTSGSALLSCWGLACAGSVQTLAESDGTCYSCFVAAVASDASVEEARQRCTAGTELRDRLAFRGTMGLMVLSKYAVLDEDAVLLPSSSWAHGVLRVRVDVGNGEETDFYCGSTGVADDYKANPYGGPYGDGATTPKEGKLNEQLLVVERMLEFVNSQSSEPGARAILAGSIYSGPEYTDSDGKVLADAWLPDVYAVLAADLDPLVDPAFVPGCNACADNPAGASYVNNAETVGSWVTHLLGRGFLSRDVTHTEFTHQNPVVPVGDDLIPLSQQYGVRSVVRVAQ